MGRENVRDIINKDPIHTAKLWTNPLSNPKYNMIIEGLPIHSSLLYLLEKEYDEKFISDKAILRKDK